MSFTIAHDFENSKVAHMTGTGIVFIEYKKCFDMTRLDNGECITTPYVEIFDDMSQMKKDKDYRGRRMTNFIKYHFKWLVRDLTHDYK